MRSCAFLVFSMIVFVPAGYSQDISSSAEKSKVMDILPASDFMPGWNFEDKPEFYQPDALYEHVDGEAPLYLSYGFRGLAYARYADSQDAENSIAVEIFDMGDLEGGFGVYSSHRHPTERFALYGTQGYRSGALLIAWKGPYFISMLGDEDNAITADALERSVREIVKKIPGDDAYPDFLKRLPLKNRIPNSEKFIAKDYLGWKFFRRAVEAKYVVESVTPTVFVVLCPDADQAKGAYAEFVKTISGQAGLKEDEQEGVKSVWLKDPYLGGVSASQENDCVIGVISPQDDLSESGRKELMEQCRLAIRSLQKKE
ncbi:MAG: DUF6599 family protein [Candidatus Omnitrophota bacterium]